MTKKEKEILYNKLTKIHINLLLAFKDHVCLCEASDIIMEILDTFDLFPKIDLK